MSYDTKNDRHYIPSNYDKPEIPANRLQSDSWKGVSDEHSRIEAYNSRPANTVMNLLK